MKNTKIKGNKIFVSGLMIILSIIVMMKYADRIFLYDNHGRDIREKATYRIFDSLSKGINFYYKIYHVLPTNQSKLFFNQIYLYIGDLTPYVYKDTIDSSGRFVTKSVDNLFVNYNSQKMFIGIGEGNNYISYKALNEHEYMIYCVGENLTDEKGKGDDIIYIGDAKK